MSAIKPLIFSKGTSPFTIFNQYKDDLDKVFIFTTTTFENTEPPNLAAAQLTRKIMIQEKKDIDVQIINFDFTPSPIDYDVVGIHERKRKRKRQRKRRDRP